MCGTISCFQEKNMRENLFKIGNFEVKSYGLCIAVGIILAYIVAELRVKKRNLKGADGKDDTCFDMAMWAVIGGVIGAKLMFYIVEIKSVIADPSMLLDIANGFVVYGGIIGGSIACFIYSKVKKIDMLMWFDLIIPEIAIAQGFGRIGCLMAGCCYGSQTDSAFHIVFQNSHFAPNHVALYPTQIMSSVADFLNFAILAFVISRIFKKKPGVVTAFFLIFYSVGRYIIECFRGDLERGSVGAFSTSQFISFFILAAGISLLIFFLKQPERDPVEEYLLKQKEIAEAKAEETTEETAEATTEAENSENE